MWWWYPNKALFTKHLSSQIWLMDTWVKKHIIASHVSMSWLGNPAGLVEFTVSGCFWVPVIQLELEDLLYACMLGMLLLIVCGLSLHVPSHSSVIQARLSYMVTETIHSHWVWGIYHFSRILLVKASSEPARIKGQVVDSSSRDWSEVLGTVISFPISLTVRSGFQTTAVIQRALWAVMAPCY